MPYQPQPPMDANNTPGLAPRAQLPQNIEAEQSVLAACLLNGEVTEEAVMRLRPENFFRPAHRIIFEAIISLTNRHIPVDPIALADNTFSLTSWERHVDIVKRQSILRELVFAATQINALAYDAPDDLDQVVEEAEKTLFNVTEKRVSSSFRKMDELVSDAYEEISYKVEMTIKNRQSYAENDSDHMEVFKRIDRLRRMVRNLRSSSFCELMAGCAMVRSPIQRTNLMMKDPSYRTCYKLWQFIESYDEVGYTIEEQDSALEFDEEYLLQMYTNLITNYTVFKSLLEADPRRMTELAEEHREPVKPKFIKEIKEEIVEDRNIPDVEIRKVFVEEVTQAQIEAEEKLQKETEQRETLERTVSDLNGQVESLTGQMEYLDQMRVDTEMQLDMVQQQLNESQEALAAAGEETRHAKKQAREAEEARLQSEKEAEENVVLARQEAKEEVEAAKKEAEEAVAVARESAAQEIEAAHEKAKQEIEAVQKAARKSADSQAEKARREADAALEKVRCESGQAMERLRREADSATAKARNEAKTAQRQLKEMEEAKAELEARGFTFNDATAKFKADGTLNAIYLTDEICGFAVHLVGKK